MPHSLYGVVRVNESSGVMKGKVMAQTEIKVQVGTSQLLHHLHWRGCNIVLKMGS